MPAVMVYGDGTEFLTLPAYDAGSITSVTTLRGYAVPNYIEQDGMLVTVDSAGRRFSVYSPAFYVDAVYENGWLRTWQRGVPYTVTLTLIDRTPTAQELADLRAMVAEPSEETFSDADIRRILERQATTSAGRYDLNGAAADIWTLKAAALQSAAAASASTGVSGGVESVQVAGASFTFGSSGASSGSTSDSSVSVALKMADYYRALADEGRRGVGVW